MKVPFPMKVVLILLLCVGLAACGSRRNGGNSIFTSGDAPAGGQEFGSASAPSTYARSSIWDVFGPDRSEQTVNVNRYIWAATFDVLNFLPVQSVDPFTGVIVTGYGRPPGGGRAYRATVHIRDPALEARSLHVALQTQSGPVSVETTRAVEDAILSRARQLRIGDNKL